MILNTRIKVFCLIAVGFVVFSGCSILNPAVKENWKTVDLTKPGWDQCGEDYKTWTYDRFEHPVLWSVMGNDNDGVTPCFRGEPWSYWRWWARNRFHNFKWYQIGIANWDESKIPYSSHYNSHLKRLDPAWELGPIRFSKVQRRDWRFSLPFWRVKLPLDFQFWIGWKPNRGQFALSFKRRVD
jgi:hypothetical protein